MSDTSARVFSLVRTEAGRRRRLAAERGLEIAVRRIRVDELAEHNRTALALVEGDGAEVLQLPVRGEQP